VGGLDQSTRISGLIYGTRSEEQWGLSSEKLDFYDLKADVEVLLGLGDQYTFARAEREGFHPGQCASVAVDGAIIGYLGALHPHIQSHLEIPQPVFVFELDLAALCSSSVPAYTDLSRFPATRRDLAILVNRDLPVQEILDAVTESAGGHLHNIKLFDIYQGQGIETTEKSVAIGLTFMDSSRTLVEAEINQAIDSIVADLSQKFGAKLRN
jgi:phenylalanyl-tRNA synthetase beta chain